MMKAAYLLALAGLVLVGCKKDQSRVLELKTRCQHCEVRVSTGGEDQVYDAWYENSYQVVAEENETVTVQLQWKSHPNDTVNGVVTYWDSLPWSQAAWLYNGGQLPLGNGSSFAPEQRFSFSAQVPEL